MENIASDVAGTVSVSDGNNGNRAISGKYFPKLFKNENGVEVRTPAGSMRMFSLGAQGEELPRGPSIKATFDNTSVKSPAFMNTFMPFGKVILNSYS